MLRELASPSFPTLHACAHTITSPSRLSFSSTMIDQGPLGSCTSANGPLRKLLYQPSALFRNPFVNPAQASKSWNRNLPNPQSESCTQRSSLAKPTASRISLLPSSYLVLGCIRAFSFRACYQISLQRSLVKAIVWLTFLIGAESGSSSLSSFPNPGSRELRFAMGVLVGEGSPILLPIRAAICI